MKSVGILTLGCKVNTYESEYVINLLKENGYKIKDFQEQCDIYIINTCTVTNQSDSKSKKMIRQAIRRNPNACIVAMGCFIQANPEYYENGIDILIGNKDKSNIISILDEYFKTKETIKKQYIGRIKDFEDMYIKDFPGRTRAFVKIQDGCDNFCSYCIIPFVRGKCRSKKEDEVVEEITDLVNNGYKEIVLTGIHTGSYGIDLETNFAHLLNRLVKIKGLLRLRISSIEATELNEEVLSIKYNLDYFIQKIEQIRKIRPNISISTDLIIGFPGETEDLFEKTIETCKKIKFSKIHVFPYSERKGTASSRMENKIDNKIKKQRAKRLIEISKELEISYMNSFINQTVEVLIEENKDGNSIGHTGNFLHVKIKKEYKQNEIVKVKLIKIDYPYIIGIEE